ncbi:MAG: hypothetical protein AB7L76_25010 [Burkholderiaceae bacterium]
MNPTTEREAFSQRLRSALDTAGWRVIGPAALAREFNKRSSSTTVSVHAARKWLRGEAIPEQGKLRVLAEWLGVSAQWLRFGPTVEQTPDRSAQRGRLIAREPDPENYAAPGRAESLASEIARLPPRAQRTVEDLVRLLLEHPVARR